MANQLEGVIKFNLQFTHSPAISFKEWREISAWRKIFYFTQLIGQTPHRYGGLGYGNISRILESVDMPAHQRHFAISGTQTGNVEELTEQHYAVVTESHLDLNLIVAEGPIQPSSESLTHAAVYHLDSRICGIIHVHSPDIWQQSQMLNIPATRKEIAYGTPEMAAEVRRLFEESDLSEKKIFSMAGHEDGIVSFGQTLEQAGMTLLHYLALAYQAR